MEWPLLTLRDEPSVPPSLSCQNAFVKTTLVVGELHLLHVKNTFFSRCCLLVFLFDWKKLSCIIVSACSCPAFSTIPHIVRGRSSRDQRVFLVLDTPATMASHYEKHDYEVSSHSPTSDPEKGGLPIYTTEAPAVPEAVFVTGDSLYAKIQRTVTKFGVEPRGIERVPEDERTDKNLMKVGTMVRPSAAQTHARA